LEERLRSGVGLGVRGESGESVVVGKSGVWKARSIRRKGTFVERWNVEEFDGMVGTPWEPVPWSGAGELRVEAHKREQEQEGSRARDDEGDRSEVTRRRAKRTKGDAPQCGMRRGCPGCIAVSWGDSPRPHTEACRLRMEVEMRETGDEKLERANTRMNDALARMIEQASVKRGKEADTERR